MNRRQDISTWTFTGCSAIWLGDMGGNPPYWEGTGRGYLRKETTATILWELRLPPAGGVHEFGGPVVDGDLYLQAPQNSLTIHCERAHF